jgi:septum formation protein
VHGPDHTTPVGVPPPAPGPAGGGQAAAPLIYLASRSPRRSELLAEEGYRFRLVDSGIEDSDLVPGGVEPRAWVCALAYLKAQAALRRLLAETSAPEPGVVLGADTMVVRAGRLVGKPADEAEAARMMREMQNTEHEVLTGVALIRVPGGEREIFHDRATVRVGQLGSDRIAEYVRSGAWRGKAGGYNLRERIEAGWPITCSGDPGTVMGLPVRRLRLRLAPGREVRA